MAGLVGEFEVKMDAKGRFMLPSGLKKQLPPAAQRDFMLNKGFEDCLTLFPLFEWGKSEQETFQDESIQTKKQNVLPIIPPRSKTNQPR